MADEGTRMAHHTWSFQSTHASQSPLMTRDEANRPRLVPMTIASRTGVAQRPLIGWCETSSCWSR